MAALADPTLGKTFSDLITRVAEYLGTYSISGGVAAPPTIPFELDKCKRIVNDAYARFLAENQRWNFLNVPFSITFAGTPIIGNVTAGGTSTWTDSSLAGVYADNYFTGWGVTITHQNTALEEQEVISYVGATGQFTVAATGYSSGTWKTTPAAGDTYQLLPGPTLSLATPSLFGQTWRYLMPQDFMGSFLGEFTYGQGQTRLQVHCIDELAIRTMYAASMFSGTVSNYACRPLNTNAGDNGGRWELLLFPMPANVATITAKYKRFPQAFANLTDRSVCGFQHDKTLIAACFAEAEMQANDKQGEREARYQQELANSKKLDARSVSERGVQYGDRSEDTVQYGLRPLSYYGVSNSNGVPIP
jgi:hypothetical protein